MFIEPCEESALSSLASMLLEICSLSCLCVSDVGCLLPVDPFVR